MKTSHLAAAGIFLGLIIVAQPAYAQSNAGGSGQAGGSGAAQGAGQLNQGPSAGEMQRNNPPTSANNPSNLSGSGSGSNTGSAQMPAQQGATNTGKPGPEVPRADSTR